jgi:hypothetical protein
MVFNLSIAQVKLRSQLTAGTQIGQDLVDTHFVDQTQSGRADAQAHPTVFALYPKAAVLQVRQKTTLGFVVGMRNIVPNHRAFARYLTDARHAASPFTVNA